MTTPDLQTRTDVDIASGGFRQAQLRQHFKRGLGWCLLRPQEGGREPLRASAPPRFHAHFSEVAPGVLFFWEFAAGWLRALPRARRQHPQATPGMSPALRSPGLVPASGLLVRRHRVAVMLPPTGQPSTEWFMFTLHLGETSQHRT